MPNFQLCIAVIVCGKFHYHRYLKHLEPDLHKVYFSHRITESLGLSAKKRKNLWLKEYLLALHLRLIGTRMLRGTISICHAIWRLSLSFSPILANTALVLLHGNCLAAMKRLKKSGAIVWGEAVNCHPLVYRHMIETEAQRLGLKCPRIGPQYNESLLEIDSIDYLLSPSQAVSDSFVKQGFPASRIYTVPYAYEWSHKSTKIGFSKASTPSMRGSAGSITAICVAQICMRKGQYRLLEAIKLIRDQGKEISLTLVGTADTDYLAALRKLDSNFEHLLHVPNTKLLEIVQQHDVSVLPSIEDGFGMVVLESISVGTPVVVSKFAGASEFVTLSGGGLVIDPTKPADLADALMRCASGNYPPFAEVNRGWSEYSMQLRELMLRNRTPRELHR